jgi:hypothetical protein
MPPTGSAAVGAPPAGVASAPVGSASVGAASVAVGAASVGAASVGAASVGAASVPGGANPNDPGPRSGGVSSLDRGNGAPGVPPRGDDGPAPVVGAKAGAAKAAGTLPDGSREDEDEDDGEPLSGLRARAAELRNQLRSRRRLRLVTLVSLAVVVLVVLPAVFGIRTATKDPVFRSLDALSVPAWAAKSPDDQSSGSQWCFIECEFRERIAKSDKPFPETTRAYSAALTQAGWRPWKVGECPEKPAENVEQPGKPADETYTCWKRDEFTLDLWVRQPDCAVDQIAARDPAVAPSVAPVSPEKCVGATVSIKVQNAITDTRGKPEPKESRPLVGETPDVVVPTDTSSVPTPQTS